MELKITHFVIVPYDPQNTDKPSLLAYTHDFALQTFDCQFLPVPARIDISTRRKRRRRLLGAAVARKSRQKFRFTRELVPRGIEIGPRQRSFSRDPLSPVIENSICAIRCKWIERLDRGRNGGAYYRGSFLTWRGSCARKKRTKARSRFQFGRARAANYGGCCGLLHAPWHSAES